MLDVRIDRHVKRPTSNKVTRRAVQSQAGEGLGRNLMSFRGFAGLPAQSLPHRRFRGACMRAYVHVTCVCVCMCMYTCVLTCMYMFTYACVCVCIRMHVYTYVYVCVCRSVHRL